MSNPKPLSVVEVIQTLDNGGTVEELKEAFAKVSQAVIDTGNAGMVTLEIEFKKNGKKSKALSVIDKIKVKMPKIEKDPTTFYATEEGLTRRNPDQGMLAGVADD